jgi:hypothetical protein
LLALLRSLRFDFRTLWKKRREKSKVAKKADRQSLLRFDAQVEVDRKKVAVIAQLS